MGGAAAAVIAVAREDGRVLGSAVAVCSFQRNRDESASARTMK